MTLWHDDWPMNEVIPAERCAYIPFVIGAAKRIQAAGNVISFQPSGAKTDLGDQFKAKIRAKAEWLQWLGQPPRVVVEALCDRYCRRRGLPPQRHVFPCHGASVGSTAITHALAR